jgi:hypothetical protein
MATDTIALKKRLKTFFKRRHRLRDNYRVEKQRRE